jgi:hypothetical protein
MLQYTEGMTDAQEKDAQGILDVLNVAYPNHPWSVRVYPGGFFIRHLDFPTTWGMNYRSGKASYSASAVKRQIILMAGEWLERANLKRGRGDDTTASFVEGVPLKDQPIQHQRDEKVKTIETELRTEPMPQAIRQLNG